VSDELLEVSLFASVLHNFRLKGGIKVIGVLSLDFFNDLLRSDCFLDFAIVLDLFIALVNRNVFLISDKLGRLFIYLWLLPQIL
jgi:hypothetical protein